MKKFITGVLVYCFLGAFPLAGWAQHSHTLVCVNPQSPVTVVLSDSQIKSLPTVPVEIVPFPCPGKMLVPTHVFLKQNFIAGQYNSVGPNDFFSVIWASSYRLGPALPNTPNTLQFSSFLSQNNYVGITMLGGSPLMRFDSVWGANLTNTFQDDLSFFKEQALALSASVEGGVIDGGNASNTLKVTTYFLVVDVN